MIDTPVHTDTHDTAPLVEAVFDYAVLTAETRIVVQQHTRDIRERLRIAGDVIIGIGERLIEVKAKLNHGQFGV